MACKQQHPAITRRNFLKVGGALTVGSTLPAALTAPNLLAGENESAKISEYRTLGRTGFKVSDYSMGAIRVQESNIFRYAYDKGVNYFDTAEGYQNGDSERKFGQVMQHLERKKIFITTKLYINENEDKSSILDRFSKCQERMQTEYVDCLYMHSVKNVALLNKPEFHEAVAELKAAGRLRFAGVSSHGPSRDNEESMEKILTAAAADGRFDVMLFVYNFMEREEGENILKACKEHNVGTTAMKTAPGVLKVEEYDPENLTTAQQKQFDRFRKRSDSEEEARKKMDEWVEENRQTQRMTQPFIDKYKIDTVDQLRLNSIRWVRENRDMHATCVSFTDFDSVDKIIPFSGKDLSSEETGHLYDLQRFYDDRYCRRGCTGCKDACPEHLPVSTIMRYAYYYENQGREKEAMLKYQGLGEHNALKCVDCHEPCLGACRHRVDIAAQLLTAHSMLSLA